MQKRGQISIFIVLGLVLLIALSIAIYINVQKKEADAEREKIPTIEKAPVEMQPLNTFITDCVGSVAKDAATLAGMQGGIIDLEAAGIQASPDPTSSKAVRFYPNYDFQVPYWWYLRSQNSCTSNCQFDSERPDLFGQSSMEDHIETFIDENVAICLRNFEDFRNQGYQITTKAQPQADVIITSTDVQVILTYPLEITKEGQTYNLEKYQNSVPVRLLHIYELASKITQAEVNYSFLEKEMRNIISIYSDVDENKLPPFYASEIFKTDYTMWRVSEVKDRIQDLLMSFIPLFQIPGTVNYQTREVDNIFTEGIYALSDLAIVSEEDNSFDNMSVKFYYLDWWPIYTDIEGRGVEGELIMPEFVMGSTLPMLNIQKYQYYYDVSFPVVIEIFDHEAYNGRGYRFLFALEGNLKDNKYIDTSSVDIPLPSADAGTLFCNYNMRTSGNVTVETYNTLTQQPLDEVQIIYSCGQDSCAMGYTQMKDAKAVLETPFPRCMGGVIENNKQDYHSVPKTLDTYTDGRQNIKLYLQPVKEVSFDVMKKPFEKIGPIPATARWTFMPAPRRLYDNEMAIVNLEKIKQSPYEEDFSTTAVYYGNQTELPKLRLIPGKYEVDISLIYNLPTESQQSITIPAENRGDLVLPEIVFNDSFSEGGAFIGPIYSYNITDNSTNITRTLVDDTLLWEVDQESLNSNNMVTFYAIASPGSGLREDTLVYNDLDMIGQKENHSVIYRSDIEPEFRYDPRLT